MRHAIPPLIYGTAWKQERTAQLVEMAVLAGFRGIDTACQPKHYHETGVGEALKRLRAHGIERDHLFLQTKFTPLAGHDPARIPYDPAVPLSMQVAQSFGVSQRNLGVDVVDALILHAPLESYDRTLEVWRAMEEIAQRGGTRLLGVSNCYDVHFFQRLFADAIVKPSILQNRFYAQTHYDDELRAWCRSQGIIYESFWSLTANTHLLAHPAIANIAMRHGLTQAQVWYRYLIDLGIVPLIGTTSALHMAQDLAVLDLALEKSEREAIDTLVKQSVRWVQRP